jgi:hypothetical protein
MPHQVHQIGGVGPIKDRKRGLQPNPARIFPQQPSPDGMKGTGLRKIAMFRAQCRRSNFLNTPSHFNCCSAGKRKEQEPLRIDPINNQMRYPLGEGFRLP